MDSISGIQDSDEEYFEPKYSNKEKPLTKKEKKKRPKTAKIPAVLFSNKQKTKKIDRLKAFLNRKQE